jgi:flagellar hook-length control protein FliK
LNVTSHISSTQVSQGGAPQTSAAAGSAASSSGAPDQGTGAALDALLAFLNMLSGKLAAADAVDSGGAAAKTAGGNSINGTADGKSRSTLTADLSGATAFDAQASGTAGTSDNTGGTVGASQDMLDALVQKFDALAAQGPVSADALAQFRADAVSFLKAQGLDNAGVDKSLLDLSVQLSPQLTASQMAQLALPITPLVPLPQISPAAGAPAADGPGAVSSSSAAGGSPLSAGNGRAAGDTKGDAASGNAPGSAPGAQDASQNTPGAKNGPLQVNGWMRHGDGSFPGSAQAAQVNAFSDSTHAAGPGAKTDGSNAGNTNSGATAGDASSSATQSAGFSPGAADTGSGGNPSFGQGSPGGQNGAGTSNSAGTAAAGVLQASDTGATQNFTNFLSNAPAALPSGTTQLIALQIRHNAAAGTDTFTLQLEPAELGRLDVRLKFDRQGGVTAHLSADRPETLALLQRDAAELQRLLQQSGLNTNGNTLSFDLRQQGQQQGSAGSGQNGQGGAGSTGADAGDTTLAAKLSVASPGFISQSGVNIVV